MPLGEPPTYNIPEIERKAREFLEARFGHNVSVPVDVDLLLEEMDGVDLEIRRGLRENHGLDGMVLRDPSTGELFIYIDEGLADRQPSRYRMTVAEELAHVLLHRELIEQVKEDGDFEQLQNHYRWHEMERNAKRFAAAILMPGSCVTSEAEQIYRQLVDLAGYGNVAAIKKYMADQLARRFEVSPEAMRYRLGEWPMRVFDRVEQAMADHLDYLP